MRTALLHSRLLFQLSGFCGSSGPSHVYEEMLSILRTFDVEERRDTSVAFSPSSSPCSELAPSDDVVPGAESFIVDGSSRLNFKDT